MQIFVFIETKRLILVGYIYQNSWKNKVGLPFNHKPHFKKRCSSLFLKHLGILAPKQLCLLQTPRRPWCITHLKPTSTFRSHVRWTFFGTLLVKQKVPFKKPRPLLHVWPTLQGGNRITPINGLINCKYPDSSDFTPFTIGF